MKPLGNLRVLLTRERGRSEELCRRLEGLGAEVTEIPVIEVRPIDSADLESAVRGFGAWDWLLFTSVNGVKFFAAAGRLADWPPPKPPLIGVVGPGTRQALEESGAVSDLQAERHQAEGLVEALARHPLGVANRRFLLPTAAMARPALREGLERLGARVDQIAIYETVPAESNRGRLDRYLAQPPDLVVLTSSSTAGFLLQLCSRKELLSNLPCAAIGPVAAETARGLGLRVVLVAEQANLPSLTEGIVDYLSTLDRNK